MWYTYILQSKKDGKYYIGSTGDLERRIKRHNSGGNISTKNRRPLEIIYYEIYNTNSEALSREKEIKSWKGGIKFKKLIMRR
jgi:putative endonuclease